MKISLENTGRRFNKEWIFRAVSTEFSNDNCYAIVGSNGSGKSTFLQVISGFLMPSEGTITYALQEKSINVENLYKYFSVCSPFLELYEDYTAEELFDFQSALKPFKQNIDRHSFISILNLENTKNKALKNYSSGMRQRVKLALAILADTPLLLLDEPCNNLDANAIAWYKNILEQYRSNRLIMISSNSNKDELFCCTETFSIEDFK